MHERAAVRDIAHNRWPGILGNFGLTEKQLSGKHTACPMCGGKDRFRFDDKEGRGTYFCSGCGAGDGVSLVMAVTGRSFRAAALEIELIAGAVQPVQSAPPSNDAKKLERLRAVWGESSPLVHGDEGMRYLAGRGLELETPPRSLRLHPGLPYFEGEQFIGKFPALLALVVGPDDKAATLHRTYLQSGKKASVSAPRKLMSGKTATGAAIRLSEANPSIGIAEGIETALGASALFHGSVWSCVNAHGIETFVPPAGVAGITIYADNDKNFAGQKAAYAAAFRLSQQGFQVEVMVPSSPGDWLDEFNRRKT